MHYYRIHNITQFDGSLHHYLVRYCFKCKETLIKFEFVESAKSYGFTKNEAKELWEDKRIAIYCCKCFTMH